MLRGGNRSDLCLFKSVFNIFIKVCDVHIVKGDDKENV